MNHPDLARLAAEANDLTTSEERAEILGHLRQCSACTDTFARLCAEREMLSCAARSLHGRGASRWAVAIAAAGFLTLTLWIVLTASQPASPTVAPAQDNEELISRWVKLLSDPSPFKPAAAAAALRAYAGAALPALDAARTPLTLALAEEIRWPDPAARGWKREVSQRRLTIDMPQGSLEDLIELVRDRMVLDILVAASVRDHSDVQKRTAFTCTDEPFADAFARAVGLWGLKVFFDENRIIVVTTAEAAARADARTTRAPLRVPMPAPADLEKHILDLGGNSPEIRERARNAIRGIGAAAEPGLWASLDSSDSEIAGAAADLLKWLYRPSDVPNESGRAASLDKRIDIDHMDGTVATLVEEIHQKTGAQIVADCVARGLSVRVLDLQARSILVLIRSQDVDFAEIDGIVFLTDAGRIQRTRLTEDPFLWMEFDEAKRFSRLLVGAGRSDPGCQQELRELGADAVRCLRYAARVMPPDEAGRCDRLADEIIAEMSKGVGQRSKPAWFIDEPVALERMKNPGLEEARILKAVRDKTVSLEVQDVTMREALAKLREQTEIDLAAEESDAKVTIRLQNVSLWTMLRFLAGPRGLDVKLRGRQVVLEPLAPGDTSKK